MAKCGKALKAGWHWAVTTSVLKLEPKHPLNLLWQIWNCFVLLLVRFIYNRHILAPFSGMLMSFLSQLLDVIKERLENLSLFVIASLLWWKFEWQKDVIKKSFHVSTIKKILLKILSFWDTARKKREIWILLLGQFSIRVFVTDWKLLLGELFQAFRCKLNYNLNRKVPARCSAE